MRHKWRQVECDVPSGGTLHGTWCATCGCLWSTDRDTGKCIQGQPQPARRGKIHEVRRARH